MASNPKDFVGPRQQDSEFDKWTEQDIKEAEDLANLLWGIRSYRGAKSGGGVADPRFKEASDELERIGGLPQEVTTKLARYMMYKEGQQPPSGPLPAKPTDEQIYADRDKLFKIPAGEEREKFWRQMQDADKAVNQQYAFDEFSRKLPPNVTPYEALVQGGLYDEPATNEKGKPANPDLRNNVVYMDKLAVPGAKIMQPPAPATDERGKPANPALAANTLYMPPMTVERPAGPVASAAPAKLPQEVPLSAESNDDEKIGAGLINFLNQVITGKLK